jgi:hypothetical protein
MRNNRTGELERPLPSDGIYKLVRRHAKVKNGSAMPTFRLRASIYDRRKSRPEDSPTFKVSY